MFRSPATRPGARRLQEILSRYVVQVKLLTTVATAHHVRHGPGIEDPHLFRHELDFVSEQLTVEAKEKGKTPDRSRGPLLLLRAAW